MPRVNIREIDNTGVATGTNIENIAFLPALKLEGYTQDGELISLDGTYTSLAQFEAQVTKIFSTISATWESGHEEEEEAKQYLDGIKNYFIQDKGYAMAHMLLSYGLPVEYKGFYKLDTKSVVSTVSETSSTYKNIKMVFPTAESGNTDPLVQMYKEYSDRAVYDEKFVLPIYVDMDSENSEEAKTALRSMEYALKCAATRGDAYAFTYIPNYIKNSTKVDDWVKKTFGDIATTYVARPGYSWSVSESTEKVGSYGAVFSANIIIPKYKISTPFALATEESGELKVVEYTFKDAIFPGYLNYLLCYARHTVNTPDWFAISGAIRGVTPLPEIKLLAKYGDADIDIFQPREGGTNNVNRNHIAINAICNIRPYGNIIWGNRTMHPLNAPENGSSDVIQLVASDFLNIRSLCCDLKKTIYRAARRFTFDPNTDVLWINFKSMITPLLERMKSNQGIRDYRFIKQPTTKKALLAARIVITPIEAVEDFDITVVLEDSIEVLQ